MMRRAHLVLALGLTSLASCLTFCQVGDRYTCRVDNDCDTSAAQVCAGVDVGVAEECEKAYADGDPFYVNEPDSKTCYFYYCVASGQRDCGDKQCAGDTTCIGYKTEDNKIAVECYNRQDMNDAPACDGYDDTANCPDGRRVRYLEYRRINPTSADSDYRCLPL